MRRTSLAASLAVAAAATALTLALPVSAAAPEQTNAVRATLRVVDSAPLLLRGKGFHRRELVRVTVTTAKGRFVRQKRATVLGVFAVTFVGVTFDPCGTQPDITATGSTTGRVAVHGMLPRDCAAP